MITIIAHGRLAADCEVYAGKNGKDFIKFTIASGTMYNVKETIYIKCIYSKSTIAPLLVKGKEVIAYGILRPNNWINKDGKKHYDVYISIEKLTLIGGKERTAEKNEPIKIGPVINADEELSLDELNDLF